MDKGNYITLLVIVSLSYCLATMLFYPDCALAQVEYQETLIPREWIGGGEAMDWGADDESWQYGLPFTFTFYEVNYNSVYVCSNGFLDFTDPNATYANSTTRLRNRDMIAPLWDDLMTNLSDSDIYIRTAANYVCIRWEAKEFDGWERAEFEVVLYQNGEIKFNYGATSDTLSPTVGVSDGSGSNYTLSDHDGKSSLRNERTSWLVPVDVPPPPPPPIGSGDGPSIEIVEGDWAIGTLNCNQEISVTRQLRNDSFGSEDLEIALQSNSSGDWTLASGAQGEDEFDLREDGAAGPQISSTTRILTTGLTRGATYNLDLWFRAPPSQSSSFGPQSLSVNITAKNWAYSGCPADSIDWEGRCWWESDTSCTSFCQNRGGCDDTFDNRNSWDVGNRFYPDANTDSFDGDEYPDRAASMPGYQEAGQNDEPYTWSTYGSTNRWDCDGYPYYDSRFCPCLER